MTAFCIIIFISQHQPYQNRTIPRFALNLPPLSKGGGLTASHKLFICCVLLATHSPFLFIKLFCRQDGGIAFLPHPFRFSDTSVDNPSIVGSASHCNRSSPLHKGAKSDTALPTIFQNLTTLIQNHRHGRRHIFPCLFLIYIISLPLTLPK